MALFLSWSGAAHAALDFDPIFRDLNGAVVLQANFDSDGKDSDGDGIPTYRARLFGTANGPDNIKLRFRQSSNIVVDVTFDLEKKAIPRETGMQDEPDPAEFELTPVQQGTDFHWSFDGIFHAEKGFAAAKETIWIELADASEKKVMRVHLGDVWAIFGGENVRRKFGPGEAKVEGFGLSKMPSGGGIKGFPEPPPIVTYLPRDTVPTAPPADAPLLGAHFIKALAEKEPKRPQMAVTIARPATDVAFWESLSWDQAAPLTGWAGTEPRGLGVRGAIWWGGEAVAETNPPPDILPAEQNRVSHAANLYRLLQWQRRERDALDRTLRHLASRLVFDVTADDADDLSEPKSGKLTFLMVQAPAVFRQPHHFDLVPTATPPFSSWELLRGAQSQVAELWRRPDRREVIHPGTPPQTEKIGPRAYLVPTLPASDMENLPEDDLKKLKKPRWHWDRLDDQLRYKVLADRLAFAAHQARKFKQPFAIPNVAKVQWGDDGKATVEVEGAKDFSVTDEAPLEYLIEGDPHWKPVTDWKASQLLPPTGQGIVIGVRYAGSDQGAKLRPLQAGDQAAGYLPAFTEYRDASVPVHVP